MKLLEPIALADEYLMEDGKLSFDALRRFKKNEGSKFLFLLLLRVGSRWWQETALNLARIAETSYFFVKLATNIAEDSFWRDQAADIRHTYGPKKEY